MTLSIPPFLSLLALGVVLMVTLHLLLPASVPPFFTLLTAPVHLLLLSLGVSPQF